MRKGTNNWINWFEANSGQLMIGLATLFFFTIITFRKPIGRWLQGKEDFSLPFAKIPAKVSTFPRITKKYETRCREIFESLLQKPFPMIRPEFLKRSNGYKLELDGYNPELNLAFEYNGSQHYFFNPRFHKQEDDFTAQLKRDEDKRILCKQKGVTLIEIPYTITYDKLEDHIKTRLIELKYLKV